MSEDFDFNPKKKEDDKGVGKIRLGEDGTPSGQTPKAEAAKATSRKKWLVGGGIAAGAVILAVGLGAVFNNSSAPAPVNPNPPAVVQVDPVPQQQLPPAVVTQSNLLQQSVAAKEGVIYRDAARIYHETNAQGRNIATGESYINATGQEVRAGQDFAVHVSLFDKGGFSLLVAQGPYAGNRIEFMPVGNRGSSSVTYSHVGQEAVGTDGRTVVFQALPQSQRTTQTVAMKSPAVLGSGVNVPGSAWEFENKVSDHGNTVTSYIVSGSVEDGVFNVKIWNGDTYAVNFANGEYAVNSVYLYYPNYEADYARTGVEVDASRIPTVKGVLNVAPAVRPSVAQSYSQPARQR